MMTVIHMKRFSAAAGFVLAVLLLTGALSGQSDGTRQRNAPSTQPDQKAETVHVLMTTSKGDITLELNREKAPKSVENFLAYAEKGFYDGTIFHRVIENFMIQGGGFTAGMEKKPTDDPIENEWKNGLKNERGTIAMARMGNQPNSATSQFFINVSDNTFLDEPRDGAGYAVFGKVVAGMDVVDEIRKVQTGRQGMYSDVPTEPVVIRKVKTLTEAEARKRMTPAAPKTPE